MLYGGSPDVQSIHHQLQPTPSQQRLPLPSHNSPAVLGCGEKRILSDRRQPVLHSRRSLRSCARCLFRAPPVLPWQVNCWPLPQGQSSVTDYAVKFKTVASQSGWPAAPHADAFLHRLADYLKALMVAYKIPSSLDCHPGASGWLSASASPECGCSKLAAAIIITATTSLFWARAGNYAAVPLFANFWRVEASPSG